MDPKWIPNPHNILTALMPCCLLMPAASSLSPITETAQGQSSSTAGAQRMNTKIVRRQWTHEGLSFPRKRESIGVLPPPYMSCVHTVQITVSSQPQRCFAAPQSSRSGSPLHNLASYNVAEVSQPGRGPGREEVAGLERHHLAEIGDEERDREDWGAAKHLCG